MSGIRLLEYQDAEAELGARYVERHPHPSPWAKRGTMSNQSHRVCAFSLLLTLVAILGCAPSASSLEGSELQTRIENLEQRFDTDVNGWRAYVGDPPGAELPNFDDSAWETISIGFAWEEPNSICWFRRWVEVPEEVGGVPVLGARLAMRLNVDNGGAVYVNGAREQENFDWADGFAVLSESARPGERFLVAVRGINRPGWGVLKGAELESSAALTILPDTAAFLEKLNFARTLLQGDFEFGHWIDGLSGAMNALDLSSLKQGNLDAYLDSVQRANTVYQEYVVAAVRDRMKERIAKLATPIATLSKLIDQAETAGLDLSYQRVTLTVAEQFSTFAREDLSSNDLRIVTRGRWNADWVDSAVSRARDEANALLENPSRNRPVPRYTTGDVEIKRGAFWQDSRPLFFVGMGHFGQVRKDIPLFQDYGFNIAQIVVSVSSILKSEDEVNEETIVQLLKTLDNAAKHDVAIDILIEPHGWPQWAARKYPELMCETHNFLQYKIDHPKAQSILKKYLAALIPRIAGHPALFSYCLFNEPSYADASPYSHQKFQTWLEARYGNVQTMNRKHGANYASFKAIPLPEGVLSVTTRGEKPNLAAAATDQKPLLYAWYRFNQERFSRAHQRVRDSLRAYDPHTPVHSKVQGNLFDSYPTFTTGIDHEQWALDTDIAGNDNWSYYRSWTEHDKSIAGKYATNWWRQAMYYDFQRSATAGKPLFNSENHPIEDDTPTWVAERHIRTVYWQGAIHGQGATTTWVWERGDGATLGDNILTRANCTHALGQVALDMLRLGPEINLLQQVTPEIALLVVPASIPFSEDYLNAMKGAYEGLHSLGAPVGFVTERQAAQGKMTNFKAIVIPGALRISDATLRHVGDYVAAGGTILVVGNSFVADEYGNPRDWPEYVQESAERGVAGIAKFGRGTVIYRPALNLFDYQQLGEALMHDLGVKRPIRVTDETGRVATGVEYRSTQYKKGYLLNLVNYGTHEIPVRLVGPERIDRITNLLDGERRTAFLELPPLEPLLLYVETDRLLTDNES
jgi:hypothetical protein